MDIVEGLLLALWAASLVAQVRQVVREKQQRAEHDAICQAVLMGKIEEAAALSKAYMAKWWKKGPTT